MSTNKLCVYFLSVYFNPPPLFLQSNMKSMERELRCPVCEEMVKQPIVLPCLHSVCVLCAAEVLVQRGYPPPELPPEPNTPTSSPNTRSPRQARRPPPKTDRLDRVLRTGVLNVLCIWKIGLMSLVPHAKLLLHKQKDHQLCKDNRQ